jgi:molybdate transport system substrate-binding protein
MSDRDCFPAACVLCSTKVPTQASLRVLTASDLKFALTHIVEQYQKGTKQSVLVTFGSSGNMARQIQPGLEANLFMSADEVLMCNN